VVASDLDPRYTFDSFVIGPANRLASAAAKRAADAPGTSYNPLFIYSGSGLGKSHILNAIAHYAARVHPEWRVAYLALEGFLDELTRAIGAGTQEQLRERYAELNFLLMDDVQFLTGQAEAQEMLLRLLDSLSKSGSQIVLASDRSPTDIDGLDERLVSRFSGGLMVDIQIPEYETRVAILIRKAEERGQKLEDGVPQTLARLDFKNIRELAGALNKVLAIQELEGRSVSPAEAGKLVGVEPAAPTGEAGVADMSSELLGEFGSFIEELSLTVASKVEHEETPWRRKLRETAEVFEQDGFSGARLRRLLEAEKEPEDVQGLCDKFRADVAQLRHLAKELDRVGNPWPEAAIGVLKDPERIGEGESLLASAVERVRPFPVVGEGPTLDEVASHFPLVAAKAASQLVVEARPEYNPLFLWSRDERTSLALLAATARSFKENDAMSNIAITSVKEFAEDFIRALSSGVAGAWRERWWTVDLLLVYGAQDLSETERAQDEFFHLFEATKRRGAKMLITADRNPSGIENIDDRLRSRFEGGLVVEIEAADLPPEAMHFTLQDAPPEYIQDDDLWSGFDRPNVADVVIPPLDEIQVGDRAGLFGDDASGTPDWAQVPAAAPAAPVVQSEPWRPPPDAVVWIWPDIEDRIVEEGE
jgi:chromosomal replication initiator protein